MEILMNLLLMLGGVAVFMFGMKQMSSGLEQSAGSGIRNLFKRWIKTESLIMELESEVPCFFNLLQHLRL